MENEQSEAMKRKQSITNKIEAFTSQLPREDLLERYKKTHDLVAEHLYLRGQAILLGMCLKARFGGSGGNPAKKALQHEFIDWYEYSLIWSLVDVYQSIFNLIQIAWEEIQGDCAVVCDPCLSSETELFLEILGEHYDSKFKQAAKGYKLTPKNVLNTAKAARETVSHRVVKADLPITELSEQERLECGLPQRTTEFLWLPLVLQICEKNSRKDLVIAEQYKKAWKELSRFADTQEKAVLKSKIETDPSQRVYGRKFQDGTHYRGAKGGYKPEKLHNRDVTLLYNLFPALLKTLSAG